LISPPKGKGSTTGRREKRKTSPRGEGGGGEGGGGGGPLKSREGKGSDRGFYKLGGRVEKLLTKNGKGSKLRGD